MKTLFARALGTAFLATLIACRGSSPPVRAPMITAATAPAVGDKRVLDEQITHTALARLERDPAVAGAVVRAHTTNGILELTGTVDSLLARERATRQVEMIAGVRAVSNRLAVNHVAIADDALERDVRAALARDRATDADRLHVAARDGVVTVSGTTRSIARKHLAIRIAKGVRGVRDVRDEVDIVAGTKRDDGEIAVDVSGRLHWDALVDDGKITVTASNGVVRLAGIVGSAAEKRRALVDAWVAGTTAVDGSALGVEPLLDRVELRRDKYASRPPAEIERAIDDALTRDPRIDVSKVRVAIDGNVVTLRGTVGTVIAKRAAEAVARNTVGVASVANLLDVAPGAPASDDSIRRDAELALAQDPYTEKQAIGVRVVEGEATLTGTVKTVFDEAEAQSVVANVAGVRAVHDELAVQRPSLAYTSDPYDPHFGYSAATVLHPPASPSKTDAAIATDLALEIDWSPFLDSRRIQTRVVDGRVVITGTVPSWRDWYAASNAAFDAGAVAVENLLAVRP